MARSLEYLKHGVKTALPCYTTSGQAHVINIYRVLFAC